MKSIAAPLSRPQLASRPSLPARPPDFVELTVVSGREATKRQILIYSALLVPASALPFVLGFGGAVYGAAALLCGAVLIVLGRQLAGSGADGRRAARRLYAFSIVYLFTLFAALLIDHNDGPDSRVLASRGAQNGGLAVSAEPVSAGVRRERDSRGGKAREV